MKTPPTPLFLIAAANAFVGLDLSAADAATELHETFLREVHATVGTVLRPTWDAAFVHHVGYWSHFDHRVGLSSWPLPPVATAAALADFAIGHQLMRTKPAHGDLFLIWGDKRENFVRAGIVVSVNQDRRYLDDPSAVDCVVIEGDTNPQRAFRGGHVLRHQRTFSVARGDRFIRWTAVRRSYAAPVEAAA